ALAVLLAGPQVDAEAAGARDRLAAAITDPDPDVARAAVTAAATVGDRALLPPLLARLRASGGRDPMIGDALTACGAGAEDELARALADPALPITARCAVAHAMGRLGGPVMVGRLLDVIEAGPPVTSDAVRTAAMRALERAARRQPLPDDQRARVDRIIDAELTAGYQAMAAADGLGAVESLANADGTRAAPRFLPASEGGAEALLSRSLRDRHDACRDRVLLLVAALHPGTGVDVIAANLREPDPARRANAVEALDSALDRELRARVIPLVDESPRPDKLTAVRARFALRHRDVNQWIAELLQDPAPWLVACTAHYAGAMELGSARPRLEQLRDHADATVREAVADALTRLRRPHA
ncbi:MAG TPA: hypothetical protein VHE35_04185, partial [Kofleriaceae bacterium]|nr:hypothetical protein [Kofleriaceae bacterium]